MIDKWDTYVYVYLYIDTYTTCNHGLGRVWVYVFVACNSVLSDVFWCVWCLGYSYIMYLCIYIYIIMYICIWICLGFGVYLYYVFMYIYIYVYVFGCVWGLGYVWNMCGIRPAFDVTFRVVYIWNRFGTFGNW